MAIQRKANLIVVLNHGAFFKQYHVREAKLPQKQPAKIMAKVAETMAWKGGKRVGLGSKETWPAQNGSGWRAHQLIPCTPCRMTTHPLDQPPPPTGLGLAALISTS